MTAAAVSWSIASAAAGITALAAGQGAFLARGSTAVPAAVWALVAALALAAETACRAAGGLIDPGAASAARLVVVGLGVCPAMSLLGAKRPQHGAWQFIVATLAIVVALPAVTSTLVRPGTPPDVGILWRWFLPALVAVGWMNFIATRRALAVSLVALGQVVLAREFLPLAVPVSPAARAAVLDAVGASLVAAGSVLAAVQSLAARPPATPAAWIDRPYLAIRETLGAAWALRIADRFNAVAVERGWPCRLRFAGLDHGAAGDGPWRPSAERTFRALARRFVTVAWLRRHAAAANDVAPAGGCR